MNGIWIDYKCGGAETISQAFGFIVFRDGDTRKLMIFWSESDNDQISTIKGNYYDIDAIISDTKRAIKNRDRLIEIDLEKYELN